jgi:DNA mismatch repair protein MutS
MGSPPAADPDPDAAPAVSGVSLLFPGSARPDPTPLEGEWLVDLRLDQLISQVAAGREYYLLPGLFRQRLRDPAVVRYRQAVCQDLERAEVAGAWREFGRAMADARACLARSDQLRHTFERALWFLAAVLAYVRGVEGLSSALESATPTSVGMDAVRRFVLTYRDSEEFSGLGRSARAVEEELSAVRYSVRVVGNRVVVGRLANEPDLGEEVGEAFLRFQQATAEERRFDLRPPGQLDPVELRILDRVVKHFPAPFAGLRAFWESSEGFRHPTLAELEREAQFYLAYLEFLEPLRQSGLPVCYPDLESSTGYIWAKSAFDLVLARKLCGEGQKVVTNDFALSGPERFLVVSGPNQGGKTTFAVTFGQLHHLAGLGLPVAGEGARLRLCDLICTHFGRTEELYDLQGRLESDIAALAAILDRVTDRSIVILNETFGSASLEDARLLGRRALELLAGRDARGVFVTFIDELAELGPTTVSMVATVAPDDPADRTFKVVRRPPDGRAYALAIARKYGLMRDQLESRLQR